MATASLGWQYVVYAGCFVDLFPVSDVVEHLLGDECWCRPQIKRHWDMLPMIVHRAVDGRP